LSPRAARHCTARTCLDVGKHQLGDLAEGRAARALLGMALTALFATVV
jgi:hypothetical protein